MADDEKLLNVRIPDQLKRDAKAVAAKEGRSLKALIEDAIRAYINVKQAAQTAK